MTAKSKKHPSGRSDCFDPIAVGRHFSSLASNNIAGLVIRKSRILVTVWVLLWIWLWLCSRSISLAGFGLQWTHKHQQATANIHKQAATSITLAATKLSSRNFQLTHNLEFNLNFHFNFNFNFDAATSIRNCDCFAYLCARSYLWPSSFRAFEPSSLRASEHPKARRWSRQRVASAQLH